MFLFNSYASAAHHGLNGCDLLLRGLDPVAVAERQPLLGPLIQQQRGVGAGGARRWAPAARRPAGVLGGGRGLEADTGTWGRCAGARGRGVGGGGAGRAAGSVRRVRGGSPRRRRGRAGSTRRRGGRRSSSAGCAAAGGAGTRGRSPAGRSGP
ncbi:hypothetical protein AMQ83_26410, partial [Paenibacillus riograndensis]